VPLAPQERALLLLLLLLLLQWGEEGAEGNSHV